MLLVDGDEWSAGFGRLRKAKERKRYCRSSFVDMEPPADDSRLLVPAESRVEDPFESSAFVEGESGGVVVGRLSVLLSANLLRR